MREVERYLQDEAKALFLYSPFTLFAVSDRVAFTPYDTCMSELAETRSRVEAEGGAGGSRAATFRDEKAA